MVFTGPALGVTDVTVGTGGFVMLTGKELESATAPGLCTVMFAVPVEVNRFADTDAVRKYEYPVGVLVGS